MNADYEKKGPFVKDGEMISDREIWKADMNPDSEKKFDDYLYTKELNKAALKELAKRNFQNSYESLMEDFK